MLSVTNWVAREPEGAEQKPGTTATGMGMKRAAMVRAAVTGLQGKPMLVLDPRCKDCPTSLSHLVAHVHYTGTHFKAYQLLHQPV